MEGRASRIAWGGIVLLLLFIAVSAPIKVVQAHAARSYVVSMAGLAYSPTVLTVPRGVTVRFENHDVSPHTVTADDGSVDSGVLLPGQSFDLVVRRSFDYHCQIHPFMRARILVT